MSRLRRIRLGLGCALLALLPCCPVQADDAEAARHDLAIKWASSTDGKSISLIVQNSGEHRYHFASNAELRYPFADPRLERVDDALQPSLLRVVAAFNAPQEKRPYLSNRGVSAPPVEINPGDATPIQIFLPKEAIQAATLSSTVTFSVLYGGQRITSVVFSNNDGAWVRQ